MLADNNYNPNESVEMFIRRRISKFEEDVVRVPVKRKRKPRNQNKTKTPSEIYGPHYDRYLISDRSKKADAQIVLGCYFHLYKILFEEEDPEWVGQSCVKIIRNINHMSHAVCEGDFSKLIEFLETLLPLWAKRLREGENFPNTRPSIDALFVRRKIWAQRFAFYHQWKN